MDKIYEYSEAFCNTLMETECLLLERPSGLVCYSQRIGYRRRG